MKNSPIVFFIFLVAAASVNADIYVRQVQHTDSVTIMGKTEPAKDAVKEIWISRDKIATHSAKTSMIIDTGNKVMYMINHGLKTYIPMTMPVNMIEYIPEQMASTMKAMMDSMVIDVTSNGKTKMVKQWNCEGYDVVINIMGMEMKLKIWASMEVPFDWEEVSEKMRCGMMPAQMQFSQAAVEAMKKIKGFWIRSEFTMSVMGVPVTSRTEVAEITEKPSGSDTYSIPEGYEKQEKISIEEMQRK